MNTVYLIDRWERLLRIIDNQYGNENNAEEKFKSKFSFRNKTILELGCGPVLGYAPLAIYNGAKEYYYHEPSLVRSVVESNEVKEKYYRPLYNELRSNYGEKMSFDIFYEKIITLCIPTNFERQDSIDLIISNSVLEHIPRSLINDILSSLFFVLKVDGYFFHSVDFSSHGIGGKGFGSMYSSNRKKEWEDLNLFRMSEMVNLIEGNGFNIIQSTVYRTANIENESLHESWKGYLNDDLIAKTVLLVGSKKLIR